MARYPYLGSAAALGVLMLASPGGASETITYTYDAHGRLVKVEHAGSVNDGVVVDYSFDQADNRTNVTVTGAGAPGNVAFAIGNASVTEGGIAQFTVTKTGTASGTLSVQYASATGTAAASDFTAVSGTLSFAQNETSKTIAVQTTQDSSYEGNETFTVMLSNPSAGATIDTAIGTGTIANDDPAPPSFAVSNAPPVTEGGNLVYTVTKTGSGAANVSYATANGSASAGSDYTAASGTLVFASADTAKTITVATTDDAVVESSETVLVNLSGPTGGATISDGQGSGTITDNDVPPASFAISAGSAVTEGGTLTYTVTKTGSGAADVSYATSGGTATAGSDYTATSGTLSFLSTDTSKTINVPTTDDSASESAETVQVTLSAPTGGAAITTATASNTINDNDAAPATTVSVADYQYEEGGYLRFYITRSGPGKSFSVSYATSDGTATAGPDYDAKSGTVNFSSWETTEEVRVYTNEDSTGEPDETFFFTLSNPTNGAGIANGTATGTILDDDGGPGGGGNGSSFTITDAQASEGGSVFFEIHRSGSMSHTSNVTIATSNGSAVAPGDYQSKTQNFSFSPSDDYAWFNVDTRRDNQSEGDETFTVTLTSQTSGDTVTDSTGVGTIIDGH